MTKKYKYSATEAQLQPVALTVVLANLVVAGILVGMVSIGASPRVVGAYEVSSTK
jgi:hypothetical protein